MKCFWINKGKIVEGLPTEVPYDPAVEISDGIVPRADFLLESTDDEGQDRMKENLSAASELAYFELIPEFKKKYTTVLIAFDPTEYRLAPDGGDNSEVLYRSPELFVIKSPYDQCLLMPIGSAPSSYYYTIVKQKLVKRKIDDAFEAYLERFSILARRKGGVTTTYKFSS